MSTITPDNTVNYQTLANWLLTGLVGVLSWIYIFIMNRNDKSLDGLRKEVDTMREMIAQQSKMLAIQETQIKYMGEEMKRIREILEG